MKGGKRLRDHAKQCAMSSKITLPFLKGGKDSLLSTSKSVVHGSTKKLEEENIEERYSSEAVSRQSGL